MTTIYRQAVIEYFKLTSFSKQPQYDLVEINKCHSESLDLHDLVLLDTFHILMGGERESVPKIGFAEGGERYVTEGCKVVKCDWVTFKGLSGRRQRRESGIWDWLGIESPTGAEMILISHLRAS